MPSTPDLDRSCNVEPPFFGYFILEDDLLYWSSVNGNMRAKESVSFVCARVSHYDENPALSQ